MRKVLIVSIGVVAALAIGLVIILILSLTGVLTMNGLGMELVSRNTYTASQLDDISVYYHSEKITLLPASGDAVVVEEYKSAWADKQPIATARQEGSRLEVASEEGWRFTLLSLWHAEVKVYVPASWPGALKLKSSSGGVRAEGAFSLGSFAGEASSGSVRVEELQCAGDITLASSSGSVSAERLLAGGDVSATANSGSVRPGRVQARQITASTNSGTVHFEQASAGRISATASSGSVRVDEVEGAFEHKTTSGGVTVEGGAGHGTAEASSGSVKVTLSRLDGDIEMKTNSGGCRLTVPEGPVEVNASTNSGGIHLPEGGSENWNKKGNDVTATFGEGARHQVKMRASSGSVRLEWD